MGVKDDNKNKTYKIFGSRKEADNHTADLLLVDDDFKASLEEARDYFSLPKLDTSDLSIGYIYGNYNYDELFNTGFTNFLWDKNRLYFTKMIFKILYKYNLGLNFFSWVQYLILYQEPDPKGIPSNDRLFNQLRNNPFELHRISQNTQEKKTIINWAREGIGLSKTGRIPKEHKEFFITLNKVLNKSKPLIRKPRIDHFVDFEIKKRHGKILPLPGIEFEGPRKNTYANLATAFSKNDFSTSEEDRKSIQRIQKNQQRLKKQGQKLKN